MNTYPPEILKIVNDSQFTIFIGKNGSGKSTLMRGLNGFEDLVTSYISPERGGALKYSPGVEDAINSRKNFLGELRQRNHTSGFREQSMSQLRLLEINILRKIEENESLRLDLDYKFDTILDQINNLLSQIKFTRSAKGFSIKSLEGEDIAEDDISSGETEIISLAIEVLAFAHLKEMSPVESTEPQHVPNRRDFRKGMGVVETGIDLSQYHKLLGNKILLLDEPDVHLHPDLQQQFIQFVEKIALENNIHVVIASHSTAIISAFSQESNPTILPILDRNQKNFTKIRRSEISEEGISLFGVHPLSIILNKFPT